MNFNELLTVMIQKGISDIHFKAESVPQVRVNGRLIPTGVGAMSVPQIEELAYSLMSSKQKEQFIAENELDFAFSIDKVSRFRVNVYRQKGLPALVMRVVPLAVKNFEELQLPVETMQKLAGEPRGLIIMAGVTGAGKTTTMNSLIDYINEHFHYNIISIEDPVEYYHHDKQSSISQREVGSDTHSFTRALKHVLRQDPDVVVIGEMRDGEAIAAAITAAETGHLVLSTIHTSDAAQTIDRIVDSYKPHQQAAVRSQLGNVIKGIVAQRLMTHKNGEERFPATEVLLGTSLVRKSILENKLPEVYKAMEQGAYYGMHTFDQDIFRCCKEGKITLEEALDKSSNPDDLMLKLRGIEREEA